MKRQGGFFVTPLLPWIVILLAAMLLCVPVWAEEATVPTVYVEAGEPDGNGIFDVSVSMENVDFLIYQIALKYNTDVVVPVDKDGNAAESFADFAARSSVRNVSAIGENFEKEKGVFLFTQYCMPGTSEDKMTHIKDKTTLYRFSFKRIADGDMGFDIASIYNGDVYSEFFPDGAQVIKADDERCVCRIEISYGGKVKEAESVYYSYSELYPKNFTKEQRLVGTVYVVNKDYAAAVEGVLAAIDSGNKSVVPYKKDGVQYYPLRFICESLGLSVNWDDAEKKVTVTGKNGTVKELFVEKEAQAEIVHSRTMVSGELLCELTGARIYEYPNGGSVIYDAIPEWTPERDAEKEALGAMQYVFMPFFRIFI